MSCESSLAYLVERTVRRICLCLNEVLDVSLQKRPFFSLTLYLNLAEIFCVPYFAFLLLWQYIAHSTLWYSGTYYRIHRNSQISLSEYSLFYQAL